MIESLAKKCIGVGDVLLHITGERKAGRFLAGNRLGSKCYLVDVVTGLNFDMYSGECRESSQVSLDVTSVKERKVTFNNVRQVTRQRIQQTSANKSLKIV